MKGRRSIAVHEWAKGDVGIRTVCGLTRIKPSARVVRDLGEIQAEYRCKNCVQMRSALGESNAKKGGA